MIVVVIFGIELKIFSKIKLNLNIFSKGFQKLKKCFGLYNLNKLERSIIYSHYPNGLEKLLAKCNLIHDVSSHVGKTRLG